jgi:small-conductance mechanosensitive channel
MGMILTYIAAGLSVVCWILVLVQMFKQSVGKGILGLICGLYAFIWGWMNSSLGLKNIMLLWTAAIILAIIGGAIGGFAAMPRP